MNTRADSSRVVARFLEANQDDPVSLALDEARAFVGHQQRLRDDVKDVVGLLNNAIDSLRARVPKRAPRDESSTTLRNQIVRLETLRNRMSDLTGTLEAIEEDIYALTP